MGFIIKLELPNGLIINDAYAEIDSLVWTKEKTFIYVNFYINQTAMEDKKEALNRNGYTFEPDITKNLHDQAYAFLQSSPDFPNKKSEVIGI